MRIGTVYPDREAYRDPLIQPYFLSGLRSYVESRTYGIALVHPDSAAYRGRPLLYNPPRSWPPSGGQLVKQPPPSGA